MTARLKIKQNTIPADKRNCRCLGCCAGVVGAPVDGSPGSLSAFVDCEGGGAGCWSWLMEGAGTVPAAAVVFAGPRFGPDFGCLRSVGEEERCCCLSS